MLQSSLGRTIVVLFAVVFLSPKPASCAEQDPVKFIKDFYAWYILVQGKMDAVKGKEIYKYVVRETVQEIKRIRPGMPGYDSDYFLKTSNPPLNISGVGIHVRQVEDIGGRTFVALVGFTIAHRKHDLDSVVVIFKKNKGSFKIVKCIDIYPEA